MTLEPVAVVALVILIMIAAFSNGRIGFGFALLAVNTPALILNAAKFNEHDNPGGHAALGFHRSSAKA